MAELSKELLDSLKKLDTPSIANALEIFSKRSRLEGFNLDEIHDFMPHMDTMVGYALTVKMCASRPATEEEKPMFEKTLRLVEKMPKPVIMVMQDVDSPKSIVGSAWGEVTAITYKALGVEGVIVDGAIRDLDEMTDAGFHALARRLCVSHGYGHYFSSGEPVEVFGTEVKTGDLIAADKHGFIIIPSEYASRVSEVAAMFGKLEKENLIDLTKKPGFDVNMRLEGFRKFQQELSLLKEKKL